MTEEELARHDSKTLLQLLLSADARCDALTAERDAAYAQGYSDAETEISKSALGQRNYFLHSQYENATDHIKVLTTERDRLREALESLHGFADGWRECGCGDSCYGRHAERNMVLDHLHDFARAALKGESHD